VARIDSFLRLVVDQRASDLHLRAGHVPIIRHCGDLHPIPFRVLSQEEALRLIEEIATPEQREALENAQEIDFAYDLPGVGRFRAHAFNHAGGAGAVFRSIPAKVPSIDELGLPPVLKQLSRETKGLVLVTGPTGSGKSTTMAAFIREINESSARHIITLEDPIEYLHEHRSSVITQRQVGLHVESFATGMRSALREAPDVLVVGEMRDLETMSLAMSAAETGVLVLGTLHTRSTVRAIDRILDSYPDESRDQVRSTLSVALKAAIAQHLCRTRSGESLVAAVEVLLTSYAVAHMIRDNKLHHLEGYLESPEHKGTGMQSMDRCVLSLLSRGIITREEAMRAASSPEAISALLHPAATG
jgi:twitching motility protein PilT